MQNRAYVKKAGSGVGLFLSLTVSVIFGMSFSWLSNLKMAITIINLW